MKGLIIKPHWADLILDGVKTWEIRGSNTNIRGQIGIIKSGTGKVCGTVELVDCIPLTWELFEANRDKHRVMTDVFMFAYKKPHVWVFQKAKRYAFGEAYKHPQGAVIWVNLPGGQ